MDDEPLPDVPESRVPAPAETCEALPAGVRDLVRFTNLMAKSRAELARIVMYRVKECPCGVVERMHVKSWLCTACRRRRRAEQNRRTQFYRRRHERYLRKLATGVVVHYPYGSIIEPRSVPCQQCAEAFQPRRTTAKFCSTRCRVAWHRRSTG